VFIDEACKNNSCEIAISTILDFMKEENTTCNMMEKLFNKSPLYQYPTQRFDVTGFFKGYRAFYMQKAAYL